MALKTWIILSILFLALPSTASEVDDATIAKASKGIVVGFFDTSEIKAFNTAIRQYACDHPDKQNNLIAAKTAILEKTSSSLPSYKKQPELLKCDGQICSNDIRRVLSSVDAYLDIYMLGFLNSFNPSPQNCTYNN